MYSYTVPNVINFPKYNTKSSGENEILRGIFRVSHFLYISCYILEIWIKFWTVHNQSLVWFSLPCLQLSFVCPAASRGNLPRSLKLNPLDGMGGGDLLLLTFPLPPTHTNQSGLTSLKTLFTVPAATISQFLNPSS